MLAFRICLLISVLAVVVRPAAAQSPHPLAIDYPTDGSIFPPDMAAPTFLWRGGEEQEPEWHIDISFADGSPAIHVRSPGERMRVGEIDPRAVAPTNELPKLTPEQAASHTWKPDTATWTAMKEHSVTGPVTVTIRGAGSRGQVRISTSKDPVGAPIFYRDVPLMPSDLEKGIIKPLPTSALPLVGWHLRYVGQSSSRLLLEGLHTCANCHSFSRDGRTMGLDVDGPGNDKGLYALVPVRPQVSIRDRDVIAWSAFRNNQGSAVRIGFMSQVSPDGWYVVTTIDPAKDDKLGNYYVANFKNYRFLQVFYPTRGILVWYNRSNGRLQSLPGADDPRYVQTNAVWSPDGKFLVFSRAQSRAPYPEGVKPAEFANDPNETPIQYDLYRIPFNDGKGGRPEPIAGASNNGMSNTFPKISPDGRWVVFVKCRNGQLMRPDSELYIAPAAGGVARRMRCNTRLMNSWHSFSPNGRWLVFSSKSRSPYTQMDLTHIDEDGNDSPAILIENATAANRAVNLPEFVNIPPGGLLKIDVPAAEFYRLFDVASELSQAKRYDAAVAAWQKALALSPGDARSLRNLGAVLSATGKHREAIPYFEKALAAKPDFAEAHASLALALAKTGRTQEAISHYQKALEIGPATPALYNDWGTALDAVGKSDEAIAHYRKALEIDPDYPEARTNLGLALAEQGQMDEAIYHLARVVALQPNNADSHNNLGAALAQAGRTDEAIDCFTKALQIGPRLSSAHNNLGVALVRKGRVDEAIPHFSKALEIDPEYADAHNNLGDALYYFRGNAVGALAEWRAVLRLEPRNLAVLNHAARVLAASRDESVRNGPEAVRLAERAAQLSNEQAPEILDTLAAAYAEVGRFDQAVSTARRARNLAASRGNQNLMEQLDTRIKLYEATEPLREQRP
jgi:tetratricopeptide (TPR) repeat protein